MTMAKKMQLGYREIEQRLADAFGGAVNPDEVGYQLLYSFGKSERDIERYKEGKGILKTFDGLLIKGLFCYQKANMFGITEQLELLKSNPSVLKAAPKIVAVSDGKTLLAYDLREKDTYENKLERLPSDFAFFYPLMDVERVHYVEESPADVKAAEKLAKLHDELRSYNEFRSDDDLHDLNIFISRLLFCFFAEDTGIFEENLFTSSIQRYTKEDGSDISDYLDWSFNIMDVPLRRSDTPSIIKQFPYVNGGLFSKHIQIPKIGAKARRIIIECGELNWKDINPDIFGSMIQAVVNPEERANQGMHYTSVPNIMKVINPLFMDELRGEYNKLNEEYEQLLQMKKIGAIKETEFYAGCRPLSRKCQALLVRMSKMKFFDPACGSGNFLIITYKCLRFLEMDILSLQLKCQADTQSMFVDTSVITLDQFYGIELLDFPHEVAMLSLWLAEHQMNTKLNENFGVNTKALPLKNITQIVCGNACRIDWSTVCPHTKDEEVFIFGNPPYLGSSLQDEKQKGDMESVFRKIKGWPNLDYIACWFYLGSTYIKGTKAKCAFVSTKSICQGEQVALLWEVLINNQICLNFAYSGFRWNNNAKNKAHVFCVIIGIANESETEQAKLYTETEIKTGKRITPYLQLSDNNVIVKKERKSISNLPSMDYGSKPADGGNLILDSYEKEELIAKDKRAETFIYNYVGAEDYINGKKRYCLWISDNMKDEALSIPSIRERVHKVYEMRKGSKKKATQEDAEFPYRFAECRYDNSECIIIPRHTATDRKYIPFGYLPLNSVVADSSFAIYNAPVWLFGIVTSLMHMVWTKMFGGYLGTSIRYSNTLCYNTFPFPKISAEKKQEIESAAENVLVTREYYPEKTLAELYDPDKMPQNLREAHAKLDDIVESCYPGYPFASDEARLECLFKLYEKMTVKK
ncbi:Type II restriction/modification system, DNA methylase subunit YeeA [Prevotella communis]|uniref:site-specific DNA-methyltransferase (adenine-specific) n=2 Tax=Prevotella communis TaxID=2913614 RepID=A0A1H0KMH0_9BACT|nr:Type II restriction/modification system, DNA methylase subunit YeeA [Prevotella communis]